MALKRPKTTPATRAESGVSVKPGSSQAVIQRAMALTAKPIAKSATQPSGRASRKTTGRMSRLTIVRRNAAVIATTSTGVSPVFASVTPGTSHCVSSSETASTNQTTAKRTPALNARPIASNIRPVLTPYTPRQLVGRCTMSCSRTQTIWPMLI